MTDHFLRIWGIQTPDGNRPAGVGRRERIILWMIIAVLILAAIDMARCSKQIRMACAMVDQQAEKEVEPWDR
jgi:hypothetical protein